MEETPTDASQEGVQVRTADDRVATVLLKRPGGWYAITVDGKETNVQKNFFASDGQDLPRLLASVPKAKTDDSATRIWSELTSFQGIISNWPEKKGDLNQDYDTILPFVDANGRVTNTITIGAIAMARGHPREMWGYDSSTLVKSLVPEPVAEWQPRKKAKAYAVNKVLVKEEDGEWTLVTLRKGATIKLAGGKPAMQPNLMDFSKRTWEGVGGDTGTDKEDNTWKKGATICTGGDLRSLLEANPSDTPGLIAFASENCVAPAFPKEQNRVVEGCYLACNTVTTFGGQLRTTFGGYTQAEANRAAGIQSLSCALDHLNGELDASPIFNGLSDELQKAARKARAGEPWKDDHEDFLVPHVSEKELAAVRAYNEAAARHGVPLMKIGAAEKIGTFAEAPKTEGRRRAADVMVEMDNTLTGLRTLFVDVGLTEFRPAAPGSARWQDCFWFGDKHAISHGLNVAVEDTYQKSLAEAAESGEDLLVVLRRVARREGLFAKILADADVKITTPAQLALFEREYDIATALNEDVVTRHSMYFAPNIVIRCAELEPHVLTAYGKYQYGLVINHLQFLIRDLSMRRSEALRRKRRGQPLTGRAAALLDVETRATRVTDEMAVLIDDIMRDFDDERVRAVIEHVVTLKGEEKAKYLRGARAALSRAEAASVPELAPAPAPAPRKRRAPAAAAAPAKSRKEPSSKKKRR